MDMRFYWVQDRVKQGQFSIHWQSGELNLANYFTKHHAPAHHCKMCPTYLYVQDHANLLVAVTDTHDCRGVLIRVPDQEPAYCKPATLAIGGSCIPAMLAPLHQLFIS